MRALLLIQLLLISALRIWSQDTIISNSGNIYLCKILSEDSTKVYVITNSNKNTFIDKSNISRIVYKKVLKYDETLHKNLFKTYYFGGSRANTIQVSYERILNDHLTFLAYIGLPKKSSVFGNEAKSDYKTYLSDAGIFDYSIGGDWEFSHLMTFSTSFAFEIRHYFESMKVSPKSFYLGGGLSFFNLKDKISFTTSSNDREELLVNNDTDLKTLYLTLGSQLVPIDYLALDLNLKVGYYLGDGKDVYNNSAQEGGLSFNFCIGIGINY